MTYKRTLKIISPKKIKKIIIKIKKNKETIKNISPKLN